MSSLPSINCLVWRKRVVTADSAAITTTGLTWQNIALTEQDEAEYEYDDLGHAYMLLDHFVGGNVLKNNSSVDSAEESFLAQIEPYDPCNEDKRKQILNIPQWTPQEGDLFALLIAEYEVLWLEVVNITGQEMYSDFGKKYVLNKRDELKDKEPFKSELETRLNP